MTADNVVAELHPGAIAWDLCTRPHYVPGQAVARAAIIHAATQTAADPLWIEDETRYDLLREIVHIGALPDLDRLFDRLVGATIVGFGPLMASAAEALVGVHRA